MSENIEQFKAAFRQSHWYEDMRNIRDKSDPEIFELANSERTFYKIETEDAWRVWRLASIRAAGIVMRNVGVSEIRDMILHDVTAPGPDRQAFEAAFKESNEYECICRGPSLPGGVFSRNEAGAYYHPTIALAWKFYELGAK